MFSKKNKKRGFTLVEMLIVIVIIGILAAALIPRLTSARGRANDTARKAGLQQVGTALISYQIDKGTFPGSGGNLNNATIQQALIDGGMASIPTDPDSTSVFSGIAGATGAGQFAYTPLKKNGNNNGGFVLMAKLENEAGANFVFCTGDAEITINADYTSIKQCATVASHATTCASTLGAASGTLACTYVKGQGQLRYIYVY